MRSQASTQCDAPVSWPQPPRRSSARAAPVPRSRSSCSSRLARFGLRPPSAFRRLPSWRTPPSFWRQKSVRRKDGRHSAPHRSARWPRLAPQRGSDQIGLRIRNPDRLADPGEFIWDARVTEYGWTRLDCHEGERLVLQRDLAWRSSEHKENIDKSDTPSERRQTDDMTMRRGTTTGRATTSFERGNTRPARRLGDNR